MARISRKGTLHSPGRRQEEMTHLRATHQDLEHKLRALDSHKYLTAEERLERKRIQKQKLVLKDRMYALSRSLR
jgi:hypothetical protein